MKFNFFGFGKKIQPIRNPKNDADFLEAKKKIDEYLLLKLKEAKEVFFFEDVMDIIIEYKVVSYENRNKIKKNFLKTLESILTEDEKILFAKYYQFEQFELKVYRYFIKEIENNKYSKDVLKADVIYNTILSIYKKPFSVILESFSLPGLGATSCKRLESIGILNITDYIEYLNNNLNTNNKRILETINNKIISNLKNIK